MKIVTLTLNPAFDVHCHTPHFCPFQENLAQVLSQDAGGKGVNISRALSGTGIASTALVVLGRENADAFRKCLTADGIHFVEIPIAGRIRENITLHTDNAPETRISFAGFSADNRLLSRLETELKALVGEGTILTVTGRLPDGLCMESLKQLLISLRSKGVRLVVDSRSFSLQDLLDVRPWLIKPNEEELSLYANIVEKHPVDATEAAIGLRAKGIENVMISLGEKGAVLCCADGTYVANAPKIKVRSTVGAGDSAIGGFCAATIQGLPYSERLRYAVAYGSAACTTEGTRPPEGATVTFLLEKIVTARV